MLIFKTNYPQSQSYRYENSLSYWMIACSNVAPAAFVAGDFLKSQSLFSINEAAERSAAWEGVAASADCADAGVSPEDNVEVGVDTTTRAECLL